MIRYTNSDFYHPLYGKVAINTKIELIDVRLDDDYISGVAVRVIFLTNENNREYSKIDQEIHTEWIDAGFLSKEPVPENKKENQLEI